METINFLEYPLANNFIHNWLVSVPTHTPLQDPAWTRQSAVKAHLEVKPQLNGQPADMTTTQVNGTNTTWHYFRCQEDHYLDISDTYPAATYWQTWAYTQLKSPVTVQVVFELTTTCLVEVWLNNEPVLPQVSGQTRFTAQLNEGTNEWLVRLADAAKGPCTSALALRLADLPAETPVELFMVNIPTIAERPQRQQRLERILQYAYLEDAVCYMGTKINVRFSEELDEQAHYTYQVQDKLGRVYIDGNWDTHPLNEPIDVGHPVRLWERPYRVVLKATPLESVKQNLRYQRDLPVYVLDSAFSSAPYGTFPGRLAAGLEQAARYPDNLYAEIARLARGKWSDFDPRVVLASVEQVQRAEADSPMTLAGLVGLLYRYGDHSEFPAELKTAINASLLSYPYEAFETDRESRQIFIYTCAILAGQRFPESQFSAGRSGAALCQANEQQAFAWMRLRGQSGFTEWDSPTSFNEIVVALTHLTSLSENPAIKDLAAILLDKLFFLIAVNSFKGVYGSTHSSTGADMVKSAQLQATSGITNLLWGMGVFNPHIEGLVSLAVSTYDFPLLIAEIAADLPEEMWSHERHAGQSQQMGEVNKVAYKTPDYLLSSVQDYRPGQPGRLEHTWQATFGSEALVFTNHPVCFSENEAHQPGFWRGNGVLPRVAQWKDTLIAVYNLPEDDWLGFTHAFFPALKFDEYLIQGGWAFARKDEGYLAITAAKGLELIKHAPDGYRELRSYGLTNTWLCQMGRAELDGSFADFQAKVLALPVQWQKTGVKLTNLRGEKLAFGWRKPLLLNDQEQSLKNFKHLQSQYCTAEYPANQIDITINDNLMRLNFD